MSQLPCIGICLASVRSDVNDTLEALGRGPNNISRKMCAIDPFATFETPATHYVMMDMSATVENVAAWTALIAGTIPELDDFGNPVAWGEGGIISEQDVLDAWSGGKVILEAHAGFSEPTDTRPRNERPATQTEWFEETVAGEGLQLVPDEPL